jgi:hypothetical protein
MVGSRRLSISDLVISLARAPGEDHMVRRTLQVDRDQYGKVSGLRESRMIDHLRSQLEARTWEVMPHYMLRDPDREIDIYSIRKSERLGCS